MRRKRLIATAAGALLAAAIAGGVAYATIPSDTNVFTACMLKNVGTIRLIDPSLPSSSLMSHCTSLEAQVAWNQKGQPGAAGPLGPAGPAGRDGQDGAQCAPTDPACRTQGRQGGPGPAGARRSLHRHAREPERGVLDQRHRRGHRADRARRHGPPRRQRHHAREQRLDHGAGWDDVRSRRRQASLSAGTSGGSLAASSGSNTTLAVGNDLSVAATRREANGTTPCTEPGT